MHRPHRILEGVWDAHWYGPTKTLDAHVAALRKKLGDPALDRAVRGVGFRLEEPDLRWRLVAVLVGVTLMVLVVHDLPLARHLEQVERERLVTALERDAFTLAGRMEPGPRRRQRRGAP